MIFAKLKLVRKNFNEYAESKILFCAMLDTTNIPKN